MIIENYNTAINEQQLILFLLFLISFYTGSFAQWVNSPSLNTRLIIDSSDPINISSVKDSKGGFFLIWEDFKSNSITGQSNVYFLHIDGSGDPSFRSDGKEVSNLIGMKSNPICFNPGTSGILSSAVVIWKDFSFNLSGDLFGQCVTSSGNLLWTENGIQISKTKDELIDYSCASDKNGINFIAYITKSVKTPEEYSIWLQQIFPEGNLKYKVGGLSIYNSRNKKIKTSLLPDDKGGVFLFWMEKQRSKSVIFARHIDSTGKPVWGNKQLMVSAASKNIINYTISRVGTSSIYIVWEAEGKDIDIYHQLVNYNRKALWAGGGKPVTFQKGNQLNPQALISDSTIILSWTNEIKNEKNVFVQKYKLNGKSIWNENGIPVSSIKGNRSNQKIISDGKNGAIVFWTERRNDSTKSNIYAQRINENGKTIWDSSSVKIATYYNSEKNYLSAVPDESGGAVIIFKENREGNKSIYAQKIFNTGTYASQIMEFNTEVTGDSVKIHWYSANDITGTNYEIERFAQTDTGETGISTKWVVIKTINSATNSIANYYEYFDKPDLSGTLYYRVIQKDENGNPQPSDVSRIDYFSIVPHIVVAQNSPNPFSDSTIIKFYLPQSSKISIEFYNNRVEKIDEINNLSLPAGENEITFYSHELPAGIYYYRFVAGNFIEVKKMVITN